jgi:hypothetical protein
VFPPRIATLVSRAESRCPRRAHRRVIGRTLPFIACAAVVAGCGALGGDFRPDVVPIVVSRADVAARPKGSPERAFLTWFRALQRRDARGASRVYLPSLGVTAHEFAVQREQAAYALDRLAPPRIGKRTITGPVARLRIRFRGGGLMPNGQTRLYDADFATFEFRRVRGAWKLSTNTFLTILARTGP